MPQNSGIYAVARIRCHETGLIGRDQMERLIDGTADDAVRQLVDLGYGAMPEATIEDAERMIESQLKLTYELVREVSFAPTATDLFLMKADVHNLKLLIKLRLTGSREKPALMNGGIYPVEELKRMVQDADYRNLPEQFKQQLNKLEQEFATQVDPAAVSVALDRAYFDYALSIKLPKKQAFVTDYFKMQADFENVLALLRVKAMRGSEQRLQAALLPAGHISHTKLITNLDTPLDAMGKAIGAGPAREGIIKGIDAVLRTGNISALERERDNALMAHISAHKYEFDTIGPVIGYLLGREQEARCIRLILTAKRNGLPEAIITERLRELYE